MSSEVSLLVEALSKHVSDNEDKIDQNSKDKLMNILQKWTKLEPKGFSLCSDNKDIIRLLLAMYLSDESDVRKQVNIVLTACLDYEEYPDGLPLEIFDPESLEFVRVKLMASLKSMLEVDMNPTVLSHWDICVRLLGRHLHAGASLINGLMTVVEKAFKVNEPEIIVAALRSWMVLMTNFSMSTSTLTSSKRLSLLMRPLGVKNATTEATYRAKFDTWWHLIVLLHRAKYDQLYTTVIQPFLKSCFGPPQDNHHLPISDLNSPATPISPAKNYTSLHKCCLDVLVQVIAMRPLHTGLSKPCLSSSLDSQVLDPDQAGESAELLVHCIMEVTNMVNQANKSELVKLSEIWRGLVTLLGSSGTVNIGWQHLFSGVKLMVIQHRRHEKMTSFLMDILEEVAKLPAKVLNSSANTSDHKKPTVMILELLLYQDFLHDPSLTDVILKVVEMLVSTLVSPPATVSCLVEIITKLDILVPNLTQAGLNTLQLIWQRIASIVSKLDTMSDQASGTQVTFNTCLNILKLPVHHMSSKGPDGKTFRVWTKLYTSLVEHGELVVTQQTGHICHEMTDRLQQLPMSVGRLATLASCVIIILENVDFKILALGVRAAADQPLGRFKSFSSPLGNLTITVHLMRSLVETVTSVVREEDRAGTDKSLVGQAVLDILSAYQTLLSHSQTELVRPVLKLVTGPLASILDESILKPLVKISPPILTSLEKVVALYCSLLKVKYNKEYSGDFLLEVEEMFLMGLGSSRSNIKSKISETWSLTFSSLSKSDISDKMTEILSSSAAPGLRAQVSSSNSEVSFPESDLSQQVVAEPAILAAMNKKTKLVLQDNTTPKKGKSPAEKIKDVSSNVTATKRKQARKSLSLALEEEDSAMFVAIKPKELKKRLLTDHQKDKMTSRHDDIPALYSTLSRDDSVIQLPPQFMSQNSLSNNVEMKDNDDVQKVKDEGGENSQSLLREMKERKNKRFEVNENSPSRSRRSLSRKGRKNENMVEGLEEKKTEQNGEIAEKEEISKVDNGAEIDNCVQGIVQLQSPSKSAILSPENSLDKDDVKESKDMSPGLLVSEEEENIIDNHNSVMEDEVIESSQEDTPRQKRTKRCVINKHKIWEEKDRLNEMVSPSKRSPKKGVDDRRNQYGETPLHTAAKKGEIAKVRELLKAGASPNVTDAAGWYPLHELAMSVKGGAVEILSLLIEHGAMVDVFSTGEKGVTPLQEAVMYGSKEMVSMLIKAGASTDLPSKEGKSAVMLASESDTQDMVEIINAESGKDKEVVTETTSVVNQPTTITEEAARIFEDQKDESETKMSDIINEEDNDDATKTIINDTFEEESENVADSLLDESVMEVDFEDRIPNDEGNSVAPDANCVAPDANSVSPDANKENVSSEKETEICDDKVVLDIVREELRIKSSPFTAINEKQKVKKSVTGGSRGAMLLNLATARRASLDTGSLQTPTLMSPKPDSAPPGQVDSSKRPWVKYNPSPSNASPSASILKRQRGEDLDSSMEGSPVSAKRMKLDTSVTRRVHFNANPVSESVEIPRALEGKVTRKKLMMFDQDMFSSRQSMDNQDSLDTYQDSPSVVPGASTSVFPDLADCEENVSKILHNLAPANWGKVLESDLKVNNISTVGQLARLTPSEVRTLKGIKPPKEVTVKNALKQLYLRLKKTTESEGGDLENTMVEIKKSPVVDKETTPDEEEDIKADLFSRPSPSPTDLVGDIKSPEKVDDVEMVEDEEYKSPEEIITGDGEDKKVTEEIKNEDCIEEIDGESQSSVKLEVFVEEKSVLEPIIEMRESLTKHGESSDLFSEFCDISNSTDVEKFQDSHNVGDNMNKDVKEDNVSNESNSNDENISLNSLPPAQPPIEDSLMTSDDCLEEPVVLPITSYQPVDLPVQSIVDTSEDNVVLSPKIDLSKITSDVHLSDLTSNLDLSNITSLLDRSDKEDLMSSLSQEDRKVLLVNLSSHMTRCMSLLNNLARLET